MKKWTKQQFVCASNKIHKNQYSYEESDYKNILTKVKIICPKHGAFFQTPANHIHKKQICPKCSKDKNKLRQEEVLKRCVQVHDDKYGYDNFIYLSLNKKAQITCPQHGDFLQRVSDHIKGHGCIKCAGIEKRNYSIIVKKANIIHNNKYQYPHFVYNNRQQIIKIICDEKNHGAFFKRINSHLNGAGCPKCINKQSMTTNRLIEQATKIHKRKYGYSLVKYVNSKTKIDIICPEHGNFKQFPYHHLNGHGCPKCVGKYKTKKSFIKLANKKHNNFYDYRSILYVDTETKIKIKCLKHGYFWQKPYKHLQGQGCPECGKSFSVSNAQREIYDFCKKIKNDALLEYTIQMNNKKYYSVDILIPCDKLIIEYYGDYWHCNPKKYKETKTIKQNGKIAKNIWERDNKRKKELEQLGYSVYIIWENDFKHNKKSILNNLEKLLNKSLIIF